MFKSTSDNSQIRTRNIALNSRQNSGGIDDVFRPEIIPEKSDREKLVLRKTFLQDKISKLNAQISLAKRRFHFGESGTVHPRTVQTWQHDQSKMKQELTSIDSLLTIKKVERNLERPVEELEFAAIFLEVAKEKLVDPIYKELCRWASERFEARNNRGGNE